MDLRSLFKLKHLTRDVALKIDLIDFTMPDCDLLLYFSSWVSIIYSMSISATSPRLASNQSILLLVLDDKPTVELHDRWGSLSIASESLPTMVAMCYVDLVAVCPYNTCFKYDWTLLAPTVEQDTAKQSRRGVISGKPQTWLRAPWIEN